MRSFFESIKDIIWAFCEQKGGEDNKNKMNHDK